MKMEEKSSGYFQRSWLPEIYLIVLETGISLNLPELPIDFWAVSGDQLTRNGQPA